MPFQVTAEKIIGRKVSDVFNALKEGRLFLNCGADSNIKIDFRVGGKYQIDFKRYQAVQFGEFLEIVPDKKIVFSWCQNFGTDQKPDSQVTIELFANGSNTKLTLVHTGFRTQEIADNHQKGWNSGVQDLSSEIQDGRLRMIREVKIPVKSLFEACKNPNNFFADTFKFVDSVQNNKILLKLPHETDNAKVTLLFEAKDENSTRLEIIQDGISCHENPTVHRKNLETAIEKMKSFQGKG